MKRSMLVFSLFALSFLLVQVVSSQTRKKVLTFAGYGKIKIGMTIEEASKATGYKFSSDSPEEGSDCAYATTPKLPGLAIMLIDKKIARIDVEDMQYTTAEGAKVNDSEEVIKKLYSGRVEVEPHKYEDGHYLTIFSANKERAIIFETDGKKVTRWRVGRMPEIQYVEGCS